MFKQKIQLAELMAFLRKKDGILITANARLMEYFQDIYAKQQLSDQRHIFEFPPIFSYEIWLEKYWQKFRYKCSRPFSLIKQQHAHFLWEEVVEKNNPFFFNIDGVIEEAKKAWKLCCAWNIPIDEMSFSINQDTTIFYQWATHYQQILGEKGWIDPAMLPFALTEVFQAFSSGKRPTIVLAGFDRLPPSLLSCVQAFSQDNILFYESSETATKINKTAFLSEEEEMHAFLSWAKNKSETYSVLKDVTSLDEGSVEGRTPVSQRQNKSHFYSHPNEKIACVIPNLSQKRNKLERFIQRYFSEEEYNISAGHIFSTYSMIAAALKMLSIKQAFSAAETVMLKEFYFILENHYLGEAEEEKRSLILKKIHATENANFLWKDFLSMLKESGSNLAESLEKFEWFVLPKKAKPSEWKEIFETLLKSLNWPGSKELDSKEYQTYTRWLDLLQEYQQLDLICEAISFNKAVSMLKTMANKTVFQPSKKNAKVHFLGFLEAAGLPFKQLWVTGMSAEEFPANIQLNPFIPAKIQRQYSLPHATHDIEHQFAKQLMQDFIAGGNEVVFSYISQKEGIKLKESALINEFPLLSSSSFEQPEKSSFFLEDVTESEDLPLFPQEEIRGGTSLLKNQALCPFRAFALHRLKAMGFEKLTIGLADHERGNLVHMMLEKFWVKVKTQQQLLAYTSEELEELIHETAFKTVKHFVDYNPYKANKLPSIFQKLEINRLETLLQRWLAIEIQRPTFVVSSIEESREVNLAGLTLKVRTDRMDELSNGKKIVIDYKTGIVPAISLNDERPEHPQLLLYTLLDSDVKALAFAQVKADAPLLKGNSEEETNINGIKVINWEEERQQWEQKLLELAKEFLQGKHQALPKKDSVCDTCDLQGICRIRDLKKS
jgi:probable DNA repair protein